MAKWLLGKGNTPIYRGKYPSKDFLKHPEISWRKCEENRINSSKFCNEAFVGFTYCRLIAVGPQQEWPVSRLVPLGMWTDWRHTRWTQNDDKFHLVNHQLLDTSRCSEWIGWTTRLPFQGTIIYPTLGVWSRNSSIPQTIHLYISPVAQKPLAVSRGIQRGADLLLGSVITLISRETRDLRGGEVEGFPLRSLRIHTKQQHQLVH